MENFSLLRGAVIRSIPVALADYVKATNAAKGDEYNARARTITRVYLALPSHERQQVINLLECEA